MAGARLVSAAVDKHVQSTGQFVEEGMELDMAVLVGEGSSEAVFAMAFLAQLPGYLHRWLLARREMGDAVYMRSFLGEICVQV
jgi:hypothetical protein